MASYRTTLGESARGQVWKSTLTGALYRWQGDENVHGAVMWEVKNTVADWHPVNVFRNVTIVYAQAGERFVPAE